MAAMRSLARSVLFLNPLSVLIVRAFRAVMGEPVYFV